VKAVSLENNAEWLLWSVARQTQAPTIEQKSRKAWSMVKILLTRPTSIGWQFFREVDD